MSTRDSEAVAMRFDRFCPNSMRQGGVDHITPSVQDHIQINRRSVKSDCCITSRKIEFDWPVDPRMVLEDRNADITGFDTSSFVEKKK